MKFVPQNVQVDYVCDGCWNCCEHCECGLHGKPSPCDLKSGVCPKCVPNNKPNYPPLRFFKVLPDAIEPVWGTAHAACFDLCACLPLGIKVKNYSYANNKVEFSASWGSGMDDEDVIGTDNMNRVGVLLMPGDRVMIPTGLIFDIPVGYSVRLHSRSGLALKQGLVLANHEGVIDSDYVDPTFVVLKNDSSEIQYVFHGDRIAQGEMIPDLAYDVLETSAKPRSKTNRAGGFGSTGVK